MALNFPTGPADGQAFGDYIWSAAVGAWKKVPSIFVGAYSATTPPASPVAGQLWFNTNDAQFYIYYTDEDGSQWVQLSGDEGPAGPTGPTGPIGPDGAYYVGVTAPASPIQGDIWFDSQNLKYFIYYDSYWVETTSSFIGPSGPAGATGPTGPTGPTGASTLDALTDAIVTSPVIGDTLFYDGTNWVNGPRSNNVIINGNFDIWQRGTSYTVVVGNYGAADRFLYWHNGSTAGTNVVSRQSFTPGELTVRGYGHPEFFHRTTITALGTGQTVSDIWQLVEDVRTLSNQQIVFSFWARASVARQVSLIVEQVFGTGGSAVATTGLGAITLTTSWERYFGIGTLPSISGKTVGTNSHLRVILRVDTPQNGHTYDFWGLQLEAGSTPSFFKPAGGGLSAAELALCQRYYYRINPSIAGEVLGTGYNNLTTSSQIYIPFPTTMRTEVPGVEATTASNYQVLHNNATILATGLALQQVTRTAARLNVTVASGLTGGQGAMLLAANTSATLGFNAEL